MGGGPENTRVPAEQVVPHYPTIPPDWEIIDIIEDVTVGTDLHDFTVSYDDDYRRFHTFSWATGNCDKSLKINHLEYYVISYCKRELIQVPKLLFEANKTSRNCLVDAIPSHYFLKLLCKTSCHTVACHKNFVHSHAFLLRFVTSVSELVTSLRIKYSFIYCIIFSNKLSEHFYSHI